MNAGGALDRRLLCPTMSQNPYAQVPEPMGNGSMGTTQEPAKTSVLAIVSLVLSLTVCLGFLGFILGIVAMILIAGSGGRKKGKGLALAAILIGLVTSTVLIGGSVVLMRGGLKQRSMVHQPMYDALRKLEQDDASAFRALLAPSVEQNITDAEIFAFRDAYLAVNGACLGEPRDAQAAFATIAISTNVNLMQRVQTPTGMEPITFAASFDNGGGGIVVVSDRVNPTSHFLGSPKLAGSMVNVAVAMSNSGGVVLTDFIGNAPAVPAPAGGPSNSPVPPPTNPPAPSPGTGSGG